MQATCGGVQQQSGVSKFFARLTKCEGHDFVKPPSLQAVKCTRRSSDQLAIDMTLSTAMKWQVTPPSTKACQIACE